MRLGIVLECVQVLAALQRPKPRAYFQRCSHELQPGHRYIVPAGSPPRPMHFAEHCMWPVAGGFLTDADLDIGSEEDWFVIPGVMHGAGSWLFSGKDWVPWYAFTMFADQPPGNAAAEPRAAPKRVARARLPDWTQVWLTRPAAAAKACPAAAHVAEPEEGRPEEEVVKLTEEEAAQVELELSQCRAWLALQFPGDVGDFHIRILGGKWTAEHTKWRGWDAMQAHARTGSAQEFCALFSLKASFRCGRAGHTRTESLFLCRSWVDRLTWWFRLWQESDEDPEFYEPQMLEQYDDLELINEMFSHGEGTEFWERALVVRASNPGEYTG